jgi:hypothetical protein
MGEIMKIKYWMLIIAIHLFAATLVMAEEPKPIVVAVIDTGKAVDPKLKYCKYGHKDITGTGLEDNNGHGTNVASLIAREAKGANYCVRQI